jgi:hypothetical protein
MRLLRFFLFASALGVLACNSNRDKITLKDEKGNKVVEIGSLKEAAKLAEESQDRAAELKKLTPLTLDQLKALLPAEIMGMPRSNFSANSMMGTGVATAKYRSEDGKEIDLQIFDCAGEAGAGMYSLRYWSLWNYQMEDDNGYQKTVDFNGDKAIEKYSKSNDRYELTFMSQDRLLVQVEGEKIGLDGVKQVAKDLNLKVN